MTTQKEPFEDTQTFHVIIERTLMTPSDPPKATKGPSLAVDLQRNSILQEGTIELTIF